jgi:hypothetical protein
VRALQLRAAQRAEGDANLEASRRRLEDLAHELDRHLAAVGEAAALRGDQGPTPSASAAAVPVVRGVYDMKIRHRDSFGCGTSKQKQQNEKRISGVMKGWCPVFFIIPSFLLDPFQKSTLFY